MMIGELGRRFVNLFRRDRFNRELEEEIQLHLDLRSAKLREAGLPDSEARYAAHRQFGNSLSLREASRDAWGLGWLEDLGQDLRIASRGMTKNPSFSIAVVLTLSLAIGANTAVFSVIETLLFQRLPVPRPTELFSLSRINKQERGESFSFPQFVYLQRTSKTLGNLFGFAYRSARLGATEHTTEVSVQLVSDGYFRALNLSAALGRTLDDLIEEGGSPNLAVISDSLWQRQFARSHSALGGTIFLNGVSSTIIGVMPRRFSGVSLDYPADAWVQFRSQPQLDGASLLEAGGTNWVRIMTRLSSNPSDRRPVAEASLLLQQYQKSIAGCAPMRRAQLD